MWLNRIISLFIVALSIAAVILSYYIMFEFNPFQLAWWQWLLKVIISPAAKPLYIILPPIIAGSAAIFLIIILYLLFGGVGARTLTGAHKASTLHGSAKWAGWRDVKQAELNKKAGAVIGGFQRAWWRPLSCLHIDHQDPRHVLAFAPTRSGKGVSLILPTLFKWQQSVFVLDIKAENYALSAGYRASTGQKIIKFEPAAAQGSFRFNPFAEIGFGTHDEIGEVQNLVAMIVNIDEAGGGKDSFWAQSGAEFLTAGILHVAARISAEQNRTLNIKDVRTYLAGCSEIDFDDEEAAKKALNNMFREWIEYEHGRELINKEVNLVATKMFSMAHQTRTGIIQNAMYSLGIFADPYIQDNMSHSDFRLRDLMHADKPVSFYLVVSPKDIDRMKVIVRILITQMLSELMAQMQFEDGKPKQDYKHRLLLMMDEFPAFGKMAKYEEMLAYMAGYGIKSYVIIQGISQLEKIYGHNQSFFTNSPIRIAFAPNEQKTAKLLSDTLGVGTVVQRKRSQSMERGRLMGNVSDNLHETSRPLLTPDEVSRIKLMEKGWFGKIKPGDMLIMVAGKLPIFGRQYLFFLDKKMLADSKIMPPQKQAIPVAEKSHDELQVLDQRLQGVLFTTTKPAQPNQPITNPSLKG